LSATVTAPGEIIYDPTLVTHVAARAAGAVEHIDKVVGDRVKKGEILALVNSARVGEAKAALLQALADVNLKQKTVDRLREAGAVVAGREIIEAEASLTVARVRLSNAQQALINLGFPIRLADIAKTPIDKLTTQLRFLGLPNAILKSLDQEIASSNLLPVTAPFDGLVIERNVGAGEVVDASKVLFVIANVSRVWVRIDVRQEDADELRLGQPITFYPDGHHGEMIRGQISWISTTVDEKTRTQQVRAIAENPEEHWRANTFGRAEIVVRQTPQAITVPSTAIQQEGACHAVFVRQSDRLFQARQVQLGVRSGDVTEITAGLQPGQVVVTTGSHVLKSELLKGRLAGDVD
jgi:cobalt-zinc-cadmium efflux system membrane fusion protein